MLLTFRLIQTKLAGMFDKYGRYNLFNELDAVKLF